MTIDEAMEMVKEKLTCMTLEDLSCIEKGCDRDCDNCEHNYGQGTSGEQKEALSIAIKALEEIQQYREIGTVDEVMELKKQNIALRNRCKILTKGQLCIFCPIRCEERAEECRNVKGGGVNE